MRTTAIVVHSITDAQDYHVGEQPARKMAGFGVGVFDEEDEDIYEDNNKQGYHRVLMDTLDFEPSRGGVTKPKRQAVTYGGMEAPLPGFIRASVHTTFTPQVRADACALLVGSFFRGGWIMGSSCGVERWVCGRFP